MSDISPRCHAVRAAYWVIRGEAAQLIRLSFRAAEPHHAVALESGKRAQILHEPTTNVTIAGVSISLLRKRLTVVARGWIFTAESTVGDPHRNKLRMNVALRPSSALWSDSVAPHGLLGQVRARTQRLLCTSLIHTRLAFTSRRLHLAQAPILRADLRWRWPTGRWEARFA